MITLISPAKTLDFESEIPSKITSEPIFQSEPVRLMKKLKSLSRKKISMLMSLSENLSDVNYQRFQIWSDLPSKEAQRQAMYLFKGEVYLGLDPYSFTEQHNSFAQNNLRILSGLYGFLRPLDMVQAYRLEMGTKLSVGRKKNLYEFWEDKISKEINKELASHNHGVVVNLASNEYYKAANEKGINFPVITPVFKDFKNGDYKVISFFAKKARGYMARWIIQNEILDPSKLIEFNQHGYSYNDLLSSINEIVFTREQQPV